MKKAYYHVTDSKNTKGIIEEGIKSDADGNIFVYDDLSITEALCVNQLGITGYTIIQINSKGINVIPILDNVAEYTAGNQFIIKQNKINPEFVSVLLSGELDFYKVTIQENIRIFSIVDPAFLKLSYIEKLKFIAESTESNKKFHDYIIHEIEVERLKNT